MTIKPEKVICDICKNEILDTSGNRSCLNWGIIAPEQHARTQRFTFLPNWWGEKQRRTDSKDKQWDFHTSCLTSVLRPLINGETE